MCANSEGSDETAQMHRLAWAFAGHLCDKYHNLMSWLIFLSEFNTTFTLILKPFLHKSKGNMAIVQAQKTSKMDKLEYTVRFLKVWSGSTLFAKTCLSENKIIIIYGI